jgi:hypothetical protein
VRARPHNLPGNTVFLNIPYDDAFCRLYVAYITGSVYLGLDPHATIEVPSGRNRLEKILELIRSCRYSIHDLSRVQLDRTRPRTPRFNMPFELGLVVAAAEIDSAGEGTKGEERRDLRDSWFVFESMRHRLAKSLSDLGGTDPHIHDGTIEGVMRTLCDAFKRPSSNERNSVKGMMKTYRAVSRELKEIERETRAKSLFEPSVFRLLCAAARAASRSL